MFIIVLTISQFKGFCFNTAGCRLDVDINYFNHPNLVKLTWKADILEYDFVTTQFRLRLEFNHVGFQGSQGICYVATMIQNVGHNFIPDIVGSQFSNPPTITNFPALGLYFSSLRSDWPDNKHGVKSLTDPTLFPGFARVFENVDNLGYSAKNIYTRTNLIQPPLNYPLSIKWIVNKRNTVTNPIENLSKNLSDNWVPLSGTFVIWNFQVELNNTLYDVADYYLPIEYGEYILSTDPLVLNQEYFGAAELLLHTEKTKVRYSELSAFDGTNWYPLDQWKLTYRIDDGNGNQDNRFGWRTENCQYLVSVCGHDDDVLNATRNVNTLFNIGIVSPTITALGATTFCDGGSVSLSSSAVTGNQWYRDGNLLPGATVQVFNANNPGSYTAKIILTGCTTIFSNAITVVVNTIPAAPVITVSGNQLMSNATSGNQWFLNGVLITGANGQAYTPTISGIYTVQVTLSNCASPFSAAYNLIVTAIPSIGLVDSDVKITPNPVTGKMIINRSNSTTEIQISLYDMAGRQLAFLTTKDLRIEIDMKPLPNGIYLLTIEDKKKKITGQKRILKL